MARLTHQEHYEAHRLLHLIYPKHSGLAFAFLRVSYRNGVKVDAEAYAEARSLADAAASKLLTKTNNRLVAEGRHSSQSEKHHIRMSSEQNYGKTEKSKEAAAKRMTKLSNILKVCEHCGIESKGVGYSKHHGGNCQSLTSFILATYLATGETRTFKTQSLAQSELNLANVNKVLLGAYRHTKGWHFERVLLRVAD